MPIDPDIAARVALRLLDESGLEKLTLRSIAKELGVKAPALYRHFANKRALLDRMTDIMLSEEVEKLGRRNPAEAWHEWLERAAHALRRSLLAHTDGGRVASGADLRAARSLGVFLDRSAELLHEAGFPLHDAVWAAATVMWFVMGNAVEEQSSLDLTDERGYDIIKGSDLPTIARLADAPGAKSEDEAFQYTLGIVLAGLRATHAKLPG